MTSVIYSGVHPSTTGTVQRSVADFLDAQDGRGAVEQRYSLYLTTIQPSPALIAALQTPQPLVLCRAQDLDFITAITPPPICCIVPEGIGTAWPTTTYPLVSPTDRIFEHETALSVLAPTIAVCTSGTSGTPKLVTLAVPRVKEAARTQAQALALTADDRLGIALSLAHVAGFMPLFRAAATDASCVLLPQKSEQLADWPKHSAVSHLSLVPQQLSYLLAAGQNLLGTTVLLGGAPASRELLHHIDRLGAKVRLSYGMTETSGFVTVSPPLTSMDRPPNCGHAIDGVTVSIANDDGSGLPPNSQGRIVVTCAHLAQSVNGSAIPDGRLQTNDLGYLTTAGALVVTGRADRIIISGGLKIDPVRIESAALAVPGVSEAAVVAVPHSRWGQRPALAVTGQIAASEVTVRLKQALPREHWPETVFVVPDLPRTAAGKVDYVALRNQLSLN